MANLFQQLTAAERRLFNELIALRDADGRIMKTADEVATDLLKNFVTQHGRLDSAVADRLGGQANYGREDVLLDLLRALTGPHPIPQAWLEAEANGGFDLFKPMHFRPRDTQATDRKLGTPGVFLQRMVAQYRDSQGSWAYSDAARAALYTEASMLTTVMVRRDLQKASAAKQALGAAWVVALAVDALPAKTKRQMDALAHDAAYLEALGEAVAAITTKHAGPDLKERSSHDIRHTLPVGADLDTFFAGHDERQLAATADALVAAVELVGSEDVEYVPPPPVADIANRLIAAVQNRPLDVANIRARAAVATAYLDESVELSEPALALHNERLRFLMPDLTSARPIVERGAKLLRSANTHLLIGEGPSFCLFDDANVDAVFQAIIFRINTYALEVGPPPPGTPMEHIPFFEAVANDAALLGQTKWHARDRWREAGLLPDPVDLSHEYRRLLTNVMDCGIYAVDVAAARDAFRVK